MTSVASATARAAATVAVCTIAGLLLWWFGTGVWHHLYPTPITGVVAGKDYIPEHDSEGTVIDAWVPIIREQCTYVYKQGEDCYPETQLTPIFGPGLIHHGPDWTVAVRTASGKVRLAHVSADRFTSYAVGQRYP